MNCFVIMPFSSDFDDVYAVIKSTVEASVQGPQNRCFRLDESRPAGRITGRLLAELRAANLCIADLTATRPNVMWEVGFAMALEKPVIVVTQSKEELPFDIKDLQTIKYDRARLSATLGQPLRRCILDTLSHTLFAVPHAPSAERLDGELVGTLLQEVSQLKAMISEVVHAWQAGKGPSAETEAEMASLEGDWVNTESGSHAYMRIVRGQLIGPYCYGDDVALTGIYFDWRRIGEYWFGRYQWVKSDLAGFSFLRRQSVDVLTGAWWSAEEASEALDGPPKNAGVQSTWVRQPTRNAPPWAAEFILEVERNGLASCMAARGWPSRNTPTSVAASDA